MRNLILFILFIVMTLVSGTLGYRLGSPKPHQTVVPDAWLDSLREVANRPPIIQYEDSIVYRDTTIYADRYIPVPTESTDSSSYYEDEYKDAYLRFTVRDSIANNRIIWRDKDYQLFIPTHYRTRIVTETIPMPYPVKEQVQYKWYAGGGVGTDGWRVRGGRHLGHFALGAYVGKTTSTVVGVEASINW